MPRPEALGEKGCSREAVSALFNGQKESQVVHEIDMQGGEIDMKAFVIKVSRLVPEVMQPRLVQEAQHWSTTLRLLIPRTDLLGLGREPCRLFKICHTSGDSTPQKV